MSPVRNVNDVPGLYRCVEVDCPGQDEQGDCQSVGYFAVYRADSCFIVAEGVGSEFAGGRGGEVFGRGLRGLWVGGLSAVLKSPIHTTSRCLERGLVLSWSSITAMNSCSTTCI